MKIVIPAAGQSQRFIDEGISTPKMFLDVNGLMMIERVMKMFDDQDDFMILVNRDVYENFQSQIRSLLLAFRSLKVIPVETHSKGPGHTLNRDEVATFVGNSPFLISYCDFIVDWDYVAYKQHLESNESIGDIVSFTGFHPASLGSTKFAYLRNKENKIVEVREKESFTDNRQGEYASTGIYYFCSWSIYLAAYLRLDRELPADTERYISLVYNFMNLEESEVSHFPVKKFLCLGTPADYEEYCYWANYFERSKSFIPHFATEIGMAIIPMAGEGKRFRDAGYRLPKPFIPINGKPMFIHTLETLPKPARTLLITRSTFVDRIEEVFSESFPTVNLIIRDFEGNTAGPGETLLLFLQEFQNYSSLTVSSCDYEHYFNGEKLQTLMDDHLIDGVVFTTRFSQFRMSNPHAFAYCELNSDGTIRNIAEKRTISNDPRKDPLVTGTFWFRSGRDLAHSLTRAAQEDLRIHGEVYVGTSINLLIEEGLRFVTFDVDNWISFGDPFELDIYHYWEEHLSYY